MAENLAQAGYDSDAYSPAVSRELGKQAAETAWIWGKPRKALMKHVSATAEAERIIGDALASGRPILFITPHIGSFEVAPVWLAERFLAGTDRYMAILYRIPKKSILQNVVLHGREDPWYPAGSRDAEGGADARVILPRRTGGRCAAGSGAVKG